MKAGESVDGEKIKTAQELLASTWFTDKNMVGIQNLTPPPRAKDEDTRDPDWKNPSPEQGPQHPILGESTIRHGEVHGPEGMMQTEVFENADFLQKFVDPYFLAPSKSNIIKGIFKGVRRKLSKKKAPEERTTDEG